MVMVVVVEKGALTLVMWGGVGNGGTGGVSETVVLVVALALEEAVVVGK